MSRIGKRPVALPSGVSATTEGQILTVKGPKGTLSLQMRDEISYDISEDGISVQPAVRAILSATLPHAMHDPTEGGLLSALRGVRVPSCSLAHAHG